MLICFEGIAGAGKSTQTLLLSEYLQSKKEASVFISSVYEGARRTLVSDFMNKSGIKSDANATMFLFQALHAAQYAEVTHELSVNKIVIADRWRYSFFAHHLYVDTFAGDTKFMDKIDRLAYRELEPNVCFLIHTPPEVAYDRYKRRENLIADNGLNIVDLKYLSSVQDFYIQIAKKNNWYIIDGSLSPDDVFKQIKVIVDQRL